MTELFNREARITVGDIVIHSTVELREGQAVRQGLDVAFEVERDDTPKPNTCDLTIWNLNSSNRGKVQRLGKTAQVIIEAGYQGSMAEIFRGTIEDARSTKDRVDWVTTVEASDGGRPLRSSRVNKSFPPGTAVSTVLTSLSESLGLGVSGASKARLQAAFLKIENQLASREFTDGTTLSGSASDEMTRILRGVGLDWSVQGGEAVILELGSALPAAPVRLAAPTLFQKGTGLIGSPEVGKDGLLKARSLMNGDLVPRRLVEVESRTVLRSLFRCKRCVYLGNTAGQDWYTDIEAKAA